MMKSSGWLGLCFALLLLLPNSILSASNNSTVNVTKPSAEPNPLDIYILIDKSLSITHYDKSCTAKTGKSCWNLMIDFVEELTAALALATNGVGPEGLRVGLTWFACSGGVPITKAFVSPASGDKSVLDTAFAKLQSIKPAGGTCPSEGLQGIYNDIEATADMTRPKAVLLMTDGLIEDNDSQKALQYGTNIRNLGAMFFTLSVGSNNLAKADKLKQMTQLTSLSGNESDRMFAADDAASLDQVIAIISALTFNSFQATFAPEVLDSKFCFNNTAKIILNGPSVDFIDFGVDYNLLCSFGSSPEMETQARRTNGVLECLIPGGGFPVSALGSAQLVRTLQVSLVLVAKNGERRALRFSKKLSLVLAKACFDPVLKHDCVADEESVEFALAAAANVQVAQVSCRYGFKVESVLPDVSTKLIQGAYIPATVIGEKFACEVETQVGLASEVEVQNGAQQIGPIQFTRAPAESCLRPSLRFDGDGCYGANLLFSFEGKNLTDTACYFRPKGGKYEPVRMDKDACLLPVRLQNKEGTVAVANGDGMIKHVLEYNGQPPEFSSTDACVRLLAVLGAGTCQHFVEGRALDSVKLQFSSPSSLEGFSCDYGATAGVTPITKVNEYWQCDYLPASSQVTLVKNGWVVSTLTGITMPSLDICASFYMDTMELCWGKSAVISVQGESLNGAVGLECDMAFQNKRFTSPLTLLSDTKAQCTVPAVHNNIGLGEMTVALVKANDAKRTPLASHVFPHIQLTACSKVEMASTSCAQVQLDAALVQSAKEFGLSDLTCEFSNKDGTVTAQSQVQMGNAHCVLPMYASSTVKLIGSVGATKVVIGNFTLDVSSCALRASTAQSSLCYGESASLAIEIDYKSTVDYQCKFSHANEPSTAVKALSSTNTESSLLCSFPFYGTPANSAALELTVLPSENAPVDLTGMFHLETTGLRCTAMKSTVQCNAELKRQVVLSGMVIDNVLEHNQLASLQCRFATSKASSGGQLVGTTVPVVTDENHVACFTPQLDDNDLVLTLVLDDLVVFTFAELIKPCATFAPTTLAPTTIDMAKTFEPSASPVESTAEPTANPTVSIPTVSPSSAVADEVEHVPTELPTNGTGLLEGELPSNNSQDNDSTGETVGGIVGAIIILILLLLLCCCYNKRRANNNKQFRKRKPGDLVILGGDDLEKQTPRKPANPRFKLKQSPAVTNVMPATLRPTTTAATFTEDDSVIPQDDILETIEVDPKPFELGQYIKDKLFPAPPPRNDMQLATIPMESSSGNPGALEEALTEVTLIGPELVRVVVHHTNHREGLGLSLGRTADGTLLVDTFLRNGRTTAGPLESCGAVWAGDALIEVNEINVQGWTLKECAAVIRKQRAMKGMTETTFVFKTKNRNLLLGYGAYQVTVPRGLVDLGLVFERTDKLVVVHKNKLAPLRNIVTLGSRLTAVDGVPVGTMQELRARTSLDAYFNVPTVRLRFESPTNPIALRAARVGDSFREGRTSARPVVPAMTTPDYVL